MSDERIRELTRKAADGDEQAFADLARAYAEETGVSTRLVVERTTPEGDRAATKGEPWQRSDVLLAKGRGRIIGWSAPVVTADEVLARVAEVGRAELVDVASGRAVTIAVVKADPVVVLHGWPDELTAPPASLELSSSEAMMIRIVKAKFDEVLRRRDPEIKKHREAGDNALAELAEFRGALNSAVVATYAARGYPRLPFGEFVVREAEGKTFLDYRKKG